MQRSKRGAHKADRGNMPGSLRNHRELRALFNLAGIPMEEVQMKKALAIMATVATVGATAMATPAEARWGHHGFFGPGLAFGLAAGALTAGAIAASEPYYWGPGYGYYGAGYGPGYYYGPGPYAYYGAPYPYYRRHVYYRYW